MRVWSKAVSVMRNRIGLRAPIVATTILGCEVYSREGQWNEKTDYDDAWFLACATRARSIVDVGANVGYKSLLAQLAPREVELDEIVLIDANPLALAAAAEGLILNSMSDRARFISAFAGASEGKKLEFWTVGTGAAGSVYASAARTAARRGRSIEVIETTLDRLVGRRTQAPDLVKIDVEGAECDVLCGAAELARTNATRFLVEMHAPEDRPMHQNATNVLGWCHDVGYRAWYLADHVELMSPERIEHRGRCHLLLQPVSWDYPEWLVCIPQGAPLEAAL